LRLFRKCAVELQKCLFDCIVEKTDKSLRWNFVALVIAKNLSKMSSMLLTLFFSSEKELSKPTKFRIKLNISPLTPSVLP